MSNKSTEIAVQKQNEGGYFAFLSVFVLSLVFAVSVAATYAGSTEWWLTELLGVLLLTSYVCAIRKYLN